MKGWAAIIHELHVKLEKFDVDIIQIKEKWGALRVIFSFEGSDQDRERIREIIQEAEDKSSVTCELWGKEDELRNTGGCLKNEYA